MIMAANTGVPRSEHPRPDFHRGLEGAWLNLNGCWDFCFDDADAGENEGWFASQVAFDREIIVPFCWESHCAWGDEALGDNNNWFSREVYLDPADVTHENYRTAPRHTIGWYRRALSASSLPQGERLFLHIGAVDWHVKVWANGQFVGESDSGYVPVSFDLTDALQGDKLVLVIRVQDPQGTDDKPLGKQHAWYTTTSGIWQTVWLEARPEQHLTQVQLTPHLSPASVDCRCATNVPIEGLNVRVTVCDEAGQEVGSAVGSSEFTVPLQGEARPWSPESPHLYQVKAELFNGETVVDTVYTYFGLREVTIAPLYDGGPKYFWLNDKPLYLKGALDQSFNPWGIYTFPTEQDILKDLALAREAGFNFLRIHIKPEEPRLLYHADKMGMLIMFDLPCLGYNGYSPLGCERWEWTFRRVVERDYNHPCIFSWILFNETWGLGFDDYIKNPDRHEWVKSMFRLAKSLDQTRPIEDNSPCYYDHVQTDINSWHFYINDYQQAREHIERVVHETYPGSGFNYITGYKQGDELLMNSEYGGIGAHMGDADVSWCFKFLTDLLRRHEKISGYVYTELQDIEWEYNGIYDYDRRPKEFGYIVSDLQGPVYLGFDCPPAQTVQTGEAIDLELFINQAAYEGLLSDLSIKTIVWNSLGEALPYSHLDESAQIAESGAAIVPLTRSLQMPDFPCLLKVEAALPGQAANWCYFEVRESRLPALERLADGRTVLRKLAGEVEVSTAWHEAEVERGVIDYETHLFGGVEAGHLDYLFRLPDDIDLQQITSLSILFEASSKRQGAPQTSQDEWKSDLHTSLNGVMVDVRTLVEQPADSRGALSHLHRLQGRYGELVRIKLDAAQLAQVKAQGDKELLLRLAVPRSALNHRGLLTYSSRAGRYPCDITLILG